MEKVLGERSSDVVIHLGDGAREAGQMSDAYPNREFFIVSGNCDMGVMAPDELLIEKRGVRIFLTHGHKYSVKFGLDRLISAAEKAGAQILLFGHTHAQQNTYTDGLYILNPGSLAHPRDGRPSYGYIDITPAGIFTNTVELL